ncbi:MAG: hypothetical protein WCK73_11325 [Deltaproteobacteria bacterium]
MKKLLTKATAASTALVVASIARASEAPDSGVTEMNAGLGTVGLLLGGVAAMGVVIWIGIKIMNKNSK